MAYSKDRRILLDLEKRKTVHIEFPKGVHTDFKIACVRHELSMQEVLIEMATRIALGDPYMTDMMDSIVESKRQKTLHRLGSAEVESLYNVLERESPLARSEDE